MRALTLGVFLSAAAAPFAAAETDEEAAQEGRRLMEEYRFEEAREALLRAQKISGSKYTYRDEMEKLNWMTAQRENFENMRGKCSSVEDCFSKFAVFGYYPLNPVIVDRFVGWVNEENTPITLSVNMDYAMGSNQYCCDGSYDWTVSEKGVSSVHLDLDDTISSIQMQDCGICSASYRVVHSPKPGITVLSYEANRGGTLTFSAHITLRLMKDKIYDRGYWRTVWAVKALSVGKIPDSDLESLN